MECTFDDLENAAQCSTTQHLMRAESVIEKNDNKFVKFLKCKT